MSDIFSILKERGFVDQTTFSDPSLLPTKISLYVGFDPTADSLHLGNLMGIVALAWFQKFHHKPYALLGGATGRIGDPSGKSAERPFLDEATLQNNLSEIKYFFEKSPVHDSLSATVINNDTWLKGYSFIDFMREVGKQFRVSSMLAKESVKNRLQSEEGMSFTEFSYQVLQAFDFYHLFINEKIHLQVGGSDQWGNITAGIELIRKMTTKTAFGLTFPLLTRSDGKKFGKSEEGAIWLSSKKLSPYDFYQYLYRVSDQDVIKLMKLLTFMDLAEILHLEREMKNPDYEPNKAQKRLAEEVTKFVHGEEGFISAMKTTQIARPGSQAELSIDSLLNMMQAIPSFSFTKLNLIGKRYAEIATQIGLTKSKSEATKLIKNGGAYLNNVRLEDPFYELSEENIIGGQFLLFSLGKKKRVIIKIIA